MARLTEQEIDLIQRARRESADRSYDMEQAVAVARELRSAALARMISYVVGAVARVTGLKALAKTLRTTWKRRETLAQLQRLNDRMLDDIGLDRGMIHSYASDVSGTEVSVLQDVPRASVLERFQAWRRERATVRELEALSDHLLDDMGFVRGDLSRMVHESTLAQRRAAARKANGVAADIDQKAAEAYRRRAMRALSRRIAKLESTQAPKIDFAEVRA